MQELSIKVLEEQLKITVNQPSNANVMTQTRYAFQHFLTVAVRELGMKSNQNLLISCVSSGAVSPGPMMHMVIAIAQLHLAKLQKCSSYQYLATRYWQSALAHYRHEIRALKATDMQDSSRANALVTTTYLLNVLAFCIDDWATEHSSLDADIDLTISSIASAGSLRSLLRIQPDLETTSKWQSILRAFVHSGPALRLDQLPAAFIGFCELHNSSLDDESRLYYRMLCYIVPVLSAQPCTRQIASLFAMVGELWTDLQPRLVARDVKALLLLAWWLALLHRLDVWWLQSRARSGCAAIVTYLSSVENQKLTKLLEFPASLGMGGCAWIWMAIEKA